MANYNIDIQLINGIPGALELKKVLFTRVST